MDNLTLTVIGFSIIFIATTAGAAIVFLFKKDLSDKEIRDIYSGLWKIEETFKITKSDLKTRPVYVWTKEHIEAHFLTCFISLVILRLLQQKTNYKNERY